jgi:solute carrier family 3, member 2
MTKDELMKYANDPFWIRLRWALFVAFWALWVAMLVGAIYIIVKAPKCSAPQPLVWYKEGPLIVLPADAAQINADYVAQVKKLDGKAVIYEVPGDDTYFLQDKQAEKIKGLVEQFKAANVKVVVDLTPNYVMATDPLFQQFVADESKRSAFSWAEGTTKPTDWLNRNNTSAWLQHDRFQVLSHYGAGRFDLNMSSEVAKDKFKGVLQQLVELGVRGVRLNDAKHYIISGEKKEDERKTYQGGSNFTLNGKFR